MSEWKSVFANDPFNDYDLVIELECDELQIGYIKKSKVGLELVIFPSLENVKIPLRWLSEVIDKANKELKNNM